MKICPVCGNSVKGRKDKIYCSEYCKSAAQYENRLINEIFFFKVDKQLKTNRKILKTHNKDGYTTLRKTVLLSKGFNPNYFTHLWKNPKGQTYCFCYEFGFLELIGQDKYLIVKWQDYMETNQNRLQ